MISKRFHETLRDRDVRRWNDADLEGILEDFAAVLDEESELLRLETALEATLSLHLLGVATRSRRAPPRDPGPPPRGTS